MNAITILFYKYFQPKNFFDYFIKHINFKNAVSLLTYTEKYYFFTPEQYSQLLEFSLLTNQHDLAVYLLKNKTFLYPFKSKYIGQKSSLLDQFMGNYLIHDYSIWLALICCHDIQNLIFKDKPYNPEKFENVSINFFSNPQIKRLYNKEKLETIISLCDEKAVSMLRYIFLKTQLNHITNKDKAVKI